MNRSFLFERLLMTLEAHETLAVTRHSAGLNARGRRILTYLRWRRQREGR